MHALTIGRGRLIASAAILAALLLLMSDCFGEGDNGGWTNGSIKGMARPVAAAGR